MDFSLAAYMFPVLFLLVFIGVPVSFSLMSTAFVFGLVEFGFSLPTQIHSRLVDVSSNYILSAIPLFIFMGAMLERSGIAARLFYAVQLWLGGVKGGLALTTVLMCAIFAATSGIVGAVEIVVGLMAIPAMLAAGYKKDLAAGVVCAGGSLGTTIPPSIVIIVYASITEMSVGDLFAGIIIPAFMIVGMFLIYIIGRCWLQPEAGPTARIEGPDARLGRKLWITLTALLPASVLILFVLGSIFAGIASPSEAAAVGAGGSILLAICYRSLTVPVMIDALKRTVKITAMVMLIVAGGIMFSSIFIVQGGDIMVSQLVKFFDLSPTGVILLFLGIVFLLGFVLDWISVILIVLPIFNPVIQAAEIDPIWFGVMVCITLQTSYLTPPMAPSIFYLRAIAPPEITYIDMYKGVAPFVGAQLLTLAVVAFFPVTATWLPTILFGF